MISILSLHFYLAVAFTLAVTVDVDKWFLFRKLCWLCLCLCVSNFWSRDVYIYDCHGFPVH